MSKSVTVTANKNGMVINQSSNPEYGYVRIQQTRDMFVNGFYKPVELSFLIIGDIKSLKRRNFQNGEELKGNIIVLESTTPFNKKDPEADLKLSGKDGIPCTINGQYIYRKTMYTENLSDTDQLIKHDNVDEIKAFNASKVSESSTSDSSDDFPM